MAVTKCGGHVGHITGAAPAGIPSGKETQGAPNALQLMESTSDCSVP